MIVIGTTLLRILLMPLIEDQIDRLHGAMFFSTLDLKNEFFHVPMNEESIKIYSTYIVRNP